MDHLQFKGKISTRKTECINIFGLLNKPLQEDIIER